MANTKNPFQVAQICFDRANRLCKQIKTAGGRYDKEQIKELCKLYADCIFCMSQGYVPAEDDRWEILNRKIGELAPPGTSAVEFRTLIKRAAFELHRGQLLPQMQAAIDEIQAYVAEQKEQKADGVTP